MLTQGKSVFTEVTDSQLNTEGEINQCGKWIQKLICFAGVVSLHGFKSGPFLRSNMTFHPVVSKVTLCFLLFFMLYF